MIQADRRRRGRQAGRIAAAAAGALAVLAAGAVATLSTRGGDGPAVAEQGFEVCLRSAIGVSLDEQRPCLDAAELDRLADRPVTDDAGRQVEITLSHPSDRLAPLAVVQTCREYDARRAADWAAMSSRELRRDGYFVRTCGVLAVLRGARRPQSRHFQNDSLAADDVAEMLAAGAFGMAGATDGADVPTPSGDLQVEMEAPSVWRFTLGDAHGRLQEIAEADFDGDGVSDILAFASFWTSSGTARADMLGLVLKPGADAPSRFAPISPRDFARVAAEGP